MLLLFQYQTSRLRQSKRNSVNWIAAVQTETGRKVKSLRTDGGGEYQGELTPVLKALGITTREQLLLALLNLMAKQKD